MIDLNICHPRLSNLTLEHTEPRVDVKVVAPELKNLIITHCYGKHLISAPGLTSLVMQGDYPLQISTQDCPSLEKVDLCIFNPLLRDVHEIVCLLQQIHGVKFLTLNVEILELISSSMGLISHQPFAFADFKILKFSTVQPIRVYLEEIRVLKDILSTQKPVAVLEVGPEQRKTVEHRKIERLLMRKL
ncbi:hypothetical protein L1887_29553 [Cichorium endivia]|nr:hypothetical protein L1887_29553 [Cichorium endivia]